MHDHTCERPHAERAVRVADHVGRIVSVLNSFDPAGPADIVDRLARRVLTNQWGQLSQAARRPPPHLVDLVRPAVAEFVVLRYLCQLLRHDANTLVTALTRIGAVDDRPTESLRSMPDPDDSPDAHAEAHPPDGHPGVDDERSTLDALADLGHRLGWALGRTDHLGRHALPTERWLAAAIGELHLYDDLTAGRAPANTSFTVHQLAWGAILLCRTAITVRHLVRSSSPLPTTRLLTDLVTECAAALPSTNTSSPSPLAGRARRHAHPLHG